MQSNIIMFISASLTWFFSLYILYRWSTEAPRTQLSSFSSTSPLGTSGERLTSSPAQSPVEEVRQLTVTVNRCLYVWIMMHHCFRLYWSSDSASSVHISNKQLNCLFSPPPGYQLNSAECTDIRSNQTFPEHHCDSYPENTKPTPKLKECNMDPCPER